MKNVTTSLFLLGTLVIIVCGAYPLAVWCVGQTFFAYQANGSKIIAADGKIIGSKLIAQPFTAEQYFHPRPSAANYDASASAASSLAASNYALRYRIAKAIGPHAKYINGESIASDLDKWFAHDEYNGRKDIVAQWATMYKSVAEEYKKNNNGQLPNNAADIQAILFDMWRHDFPDIKLQSVPADMVTTSASGLDPHISLHNAELQIQRVAASIAAKLKRAEPEITAEIKNILHENSHAPLGGLFGENFVNVLEVNLELNKRYG